MIHRLDFHSRAERKFMFNMKRVAKKDIGSYHWF
jgi:hypothetical protein